MLLFKTMVHPHLEYCAQLWSPVSSQGLIRRLESVQRSFTARIQSLRHLDYWGRLKALNIYSLERRRERYVVIYVYKILSGVVPDLESDRFNITTHESLRRGRECNYPSLNNMPSARVQTIVDNSFGVRGPKLFNCLPRGLRDFEGSAETFKSKLDSFLKLIPDQPCLPHYTQPAASNSIIDQLAVPTAGGVYLS